MSLFDYQGLTTTTVVFGTTYGFDSNKAYLNLLSTAIDLEMFVMVLSYICGLVMIIRGIAMYKAFGQNMNQATRPGEVAGPFVYIAIGLFLLYFPVIFNISLYTIYGTTDLGVASYTGTDTTVDWSQIYTLITRYCRLVGVIAFFRGMILMSKSGEQGTQSGTITKGLIHVVAGIMIYNIWGTVIAFQYTFGISKT
jgi:intracellular multiplication protein IcmC